MMVEVHALHGRLGLHVQGRAAAAVHTVDVAPVRPERYPARQADTGSG